jgi:uncharacterized membrane-anchored protein YjiN (DUF445 family)
MSQHPFLNQLWIIENHLPYSTSFHELLIYLFSQNEYLSERVDHFKDKQHNIAKTLLENSEFSSYLLDTLKKQVQNVITVDLKNNNLTINYYLEFIPQIFEITNFMEKECKKPKLSQQMNVTINFFFNTNSPNITKHIVDAFKENLEFELTKSKTVTFDPIVTLNYENVTKNINYAIS